MATGDHGWDMDHAQFHVMEEFNTVFESVIILHQNMVEDNAKVPTDGNVHVLMKDVQVKSFIDVEEKIK